MDEWRGYAGVLIRRWPIVVATTAIAILAAFLVTLATVPVYEATAVVALSPATLSVPATNQSPPYYLTVDSPSHLPRAFTPAYYVALLKSSSVANAVAPAGEISIASSSGDKSLIEITARATDPQAASRTANQWAQTGALRILELLQPADDGMRSAQEKLEGADQALTRFSQENELGSYDLDKLRSVSNLPGDKRLELARLLRARDTAANVYSDLALDYERMSILMTSTYKPTTMLSAVPAAPVSPRWAQNLLAAAGFGLLVGFLGAFGTEWTVRR